jgi:hypothetical protein
MEAGWEWGEELVWRNVKAVEGNRREPKVLQLDDNC